MHYEGFLVKNGCGLLDPFPISPPLNTVSLFGSTNGTTDPLELQPNPKSAIRFSSLEMLPRKLLN